MVSFFQSYLKRTKVSSPLGWIFFSNFWNDRFFVKDPVYQFCISLSLQGGSWGWRVSESFVWINDEYCNCLKLLNILSLYIFFSLVFVHIEIDSNPQRNMIFFQMFNCVWLPFGLFLDKLKNFLWWLWVLSLWGPLGVFCFSHSEN